MTSYSKPLLVVLVLVPCLATAQPATLSVSTKGVGPIVPETPADVTTFKRLFPGYSVTTEDVYLEDEKVADLIHVLWQDQAVLDASNAEPGSRKLNRVEILSPKLVGPHSLRVGDSFEAVMKLGKLSCSRGEEQLEQFVFCSIPGEPVFFYKGDVTDLGDAGNSIPGDVVPSQALLKKLTIRGIIWDASAAALATNAPAGKSALSSAQSHFIEKRTATLSSEEKKVLAEQSDLRKLADFFCVPAGLKALKKKWPSADRVALGEADPKDDSRGLALSGHVLKGAGSVRTDDGWQAFDFECELDPAKATVTRFDLSPVSRK